MNDVHLDDEQLSNELDGTHDERAGAHLDSCAVCTARLDALSAVAGLIAAPVASLAPAIRDALLATAMEEADKPQAVESVALVGGEESTVLDLANRHIGSLGREAAPLTPAARRRSERRRLRPMRALVGIAAAMFAIVGVGAALRSSDSDRPTTAAGTTAQDSQLAEKSAGAAGATADATTNAGPEFALADLGDYSDPEALSAALVASFARAPTTASASEAAGSPAGQSTASGARAVTAPASAPDRALCLERARAIGAGRLGTLLSAATLRWNNSSAEVLVFALTEPAEGISRQAMVMSRPGCELLADPRF